MKLVTNGCSFTWGQGLLFDGEINLEKQLEASYTGQINKSLDFEEVYNLSLGAASNQRVVRKTLSFFLDKINQGEDLSEYIAIIQFTCPFRWEVYNEYTRRWYKVWPQPVIGDKDHPRSVLQPTYLFSSIRKDLNHFMEHIIVIGNFLEKHNIKYMFTSIWNVFSEEQKQYVEYEPIHDYVKQYTWFEDNKPLDSSIWLIDGLTRISEEDSHPDKDGHALIADLFSEKLLQLYPEINRKAI